MRSVDLLTLPIVNPDAGYAMQLEINERLDSFSTVIFQVCCFNFSLVMHLPFCDSKRLSTCLIYFIVMDEVSN